MALSFAEPRPLWPFVCWHELGEGMMKTEVVRSTMKMIWWCAIIVGVVLGAPLALFAKSEPWLIAIPIAIGTLLIAIMEVVRLQLFFSPRITVRIDREQD